MEQVVVGKELKRLKKSLVAFFDKRMEAHYKDTAWTSAAHAVYLGSHKAYYPFGESTGQGTTTCPLQLPQQQTCRSGVTLHITMLCCYCLCSTVCERWGDKVKEMEKGKSFQSVWTWVTEGRKVNLFRDVCLKRFVFLINCFLAGSDMVNYIDKAK